MEQNNSNLEENKSIFTKLMKQENMPENVINNFLRMYEQVHSGHTGHIREDQIKAVEKLLEHQELEKYEDLGKENLNKIAFIKLNGGLGTSMGLSKPKSLLRIKKENNFLDIVVKQVKIINKKYKTKIPLVLMNSFSTEYETRDYLEKYDDINIIMFKQFKHPKIKQDDLRFPKHKKEHLNWNPSGHGDIYPALIENLVIENLLKKGIKYAFISNSDNLGATIDPKILGYIIGNKINFLMEVCIRTPSDKKGGHLAKKENKLILRESAQCHTEDMEEFQNIDKHKFFNTNSIWVDLEALKETYEKHNKMIPLSLIRNPKTINSKDKNSMKVYQIETAMGSAIELFEKSDAIIVDKNRFAPVKKTSDLLIVLSDIYTLDSDFNFIINEDKKLNPIKIELDEDYYKLVDDFYKRFKQVPSLKKCDKLKIKGDIVFEENIEIIGDVKITNNTEKQIILKNKIIKDEEIVFN
jgi:UTP--glucose-1-phosphate uridylyltransferase